MSKIDVFTDLYLPRRPYSTDSLSSGIKRHSRTEALSHLFIESNPKQMKNLITVDIDSSSSSWDIKEKAYDDGLIPAPFFITTNPATGNSHVGWVIEGYVSSPKALYSFGLMKDALTQLTGGDRAYTGLLVRNPLHPSQVTEWDESGSGLSIADIRKYTDKVKLEKRQPALVGEGRNRELFDRGRTWAYSEYYKIQKGTSLSSSSTESFMISLVGFLMETNLKLFPQPLPGSEINSIAKSIIGFTTTHHSLEKMELRQIAQRKKSIEVRKGKAREKYIALKEVREVAEVTLKEACEQLNIPYKTARNSWKKWEQEYGNN